MKLNDEQGAAGIELNANRNSFGYCIDEVNDDLHEIDFVSLLGIPWFCYYEDPGEPTSRWFFTEPEFRQIIKHADL
jgi:hypothetical protein